LTGQPAHVRLLLDDWQRAFAYSGFLLRYVRIWAKSGGLVNTSPAVDCIDQHWEFIGVFYDPAHYEGQRRVGEPWATAGVWGDIGGRASQAKDGHPAAYPVEIPTRNILLYTDPGQLVFEPFIGSGSTIVAAEATGRLAVGCDIEPKYVALTLQRLTDMALAPVKVN
jgi:DNA modification methylase